MKEITSIEWSEVDSHIEFSGRRRFTVSNILSLSNLKGFCDLAYRFYLVLAIVK